MNPPELKQVTERREPPAPSDQLSLFDSDPDEQKQAKKKRTGRVQQPCLFFPASALAGKNVPERRWLVEGLIPSGTVTLLSGDGGTGKSLLALQLAFAVASETKWLGKAVTAGRALFVSAEDEQDELHRRLERITRAQGFKLAGLHQLTLRSLVGEDSLLATVNQGGILTPTDLFKELEDRIAVEMYQLVVLDTLADLFPGDENNRSQARQFIGMLRGLAIRYKTAMFVLAHPSQYGLTSGKGTSGSTGWNNSVRSRLYFSRIFQSSDQEPNPDARTLRLMKANYSRAGNQTTVTWKDGVFVEESTSPIDRMAENEKAERVFLNLLASFAEQGRRVNHAGGSNYAPKAFEEHPNADGCTKRAFKKAMAALLNKEKIKISEDGPPSKRRSFLEIV